MHAHVKWEQGEPGQAIHFLERAVKIAAPEGIIRPFLDEAGPQMAALPRVHLVAPAFVEGILSALGEISAPGLPPSIADQVPLPVSLSEREFEVLQLIAEGYSNQEIAQKLVVAVSTVKKHINSIFGKLGVTHRGTGHCPGTRAGHPVISPEYTLIHKIFTRRGMNFSPVEEYSALNNRLSHLKKGENL